MKQKDLKNLTSKSIAELEKQGADLTKQIVAISLQIRSRKTKNTNAAKSLKKNLAQVLTVSQHKRLFTEK